MSTFLAPGLLIVCMIASLEPANGEILGGNIRAKSMRVKNWKAQIRQEREKDVFPREIEGTLEVAGLPRRQMKSTIVDGERIPDVEENSGSSRKKISFPKKATAMYRGPDGTFIVEAVNRAGKKVSELRMGLIREGNQNCLLKGNRAFCSETLDGMDVALNIPEDEANNPIGVEARLDTNEQERRRKKRQIVEPSASTNVINLAVFVDRSFVDRFKGINSGNYTTASENILDYLRMFGAELTYRYQTVKEYSGGMDLSVDVVLIDIPPDGSDHSFVIIDDNSGLVDADLTLDSFRQDTYVRSVTSSSGPAVHAMLLVGSQMTPNYLGVAYVGTICRSSADSYRVDITRDLDYNGVNIGAHEVGHALGAPHDGSGNNCDSNSYLMGPYYSGVTPATATTYYTFSPCSSSYFSSQISRYGNCLASKSADFVTRFCLGPRGRLNYTSLDEQCRYRTSPDTGWTICDGITKVAAEKCYEHNTVSCCKDTLNKNISHIADGTPCSGPNSSLDYYCYLGQCVLGDTVCDNSTTTTSPTTTTTTTMTTTTTSKAKGKGKTKT